MLYDVLREEIVLVNATGKARTLTLVMELYDLRGTLLRRESLTRQVPPDWADYVMEAPRWMNEVQLLRLTVLEEGAAPVINGYWVNGWAHTDYRGLLSLPKVRLSGRLEPTETGFLAEIENPDAAPALMTELRLKDPETGKTILPVFSEENFLTLLPGEKRRIRLDCSAKKASLWLKGFNVKEEIL